MPLSAVYFALVGLVMTVAKRSRPAKQPAFLESVPGEKVSPRPTHIVRDVTENDEDAAARLRTSIWMLHTRSPELSAATTLTRRQQLVLAVTCAVLLLLLGAAPMVTLQTLVALATVVYAVELAYRVVLFRSAMRDSVTVVIEDAEARAIPARQLPTYTVLAPVYREPEVVGTLLEALDALEYPKSKLDVKLILEADDDVTIAAVRGMRPPHVQVVLVPPAEPRTKPKALNYGLTLARGELVTVYDAEDRPEPLQLRRAVAAFARSGPDVACLQSKLSFYNPRQNIITRWFTAEYAMWFSFFLPGLFARRAPIPLGGTSNHFIRRRLEEVGAWDPHNVTEDADLGVRLARRGWTVSLLDSITQEEANSDFINWMKQRSRWYKGYLQTWFVHLRHPVRLVRDVGLGGFVGFCLFVGGTPSLALLNPVFWLLSLVWFTTRSGLIEALFPGWVYYTALVAWLGGNLAVVYANMISARATGQNYLVVAALLSPVYWVMMSVAAVKALLQLVIGPSFWEKTTHGLGDDTTSLEQTVAS